MSGYFGTPCICAHQIRNIQAAWTTCCYTNGGVNKYVSKLTHQAGEQFDAKLEEFSPVEIVGITIDESEYGYLAHEPSYTKSWMDLSAAWKYDERRAQQEKLVWPILTRFGIFSASTIVSEVPEDVLILNHGELMNKVTEE